MIRTVQAMVLRTSRCAMRCGWICALVLVSALARADSLAFVDPLPPGSYAVGCSNVEQDFSRVAPGAAAKDYWEGFPDNGHERYLTQLLVDPADALLFNVSVPADRELFTNRAAQQVPYAMIVCYPTDRGNPRADYPLPTGFSVPHMQRGGEAPLWADPVARWPVLVFSHGLTGSPLSNDYIVALTTLASYGYVVVAPFHGDPRFADVRIDNLTDLVYAALNFGTFVEMQAIRPLSSSAALDVVLSHPQYRDHVDPARIGGFGASLGGETLLLESGAQLTTTIGMSSKQVMFDPRLKAVASYVPYFGQTFLPAFGRDQKGLDAVTVPFLGVSGFADTTAPVVATAEGVRRLVHSRELVALMGVGHYFDYASAPDVFTWSLTFLAAHVLDDRLARARIARMLAVRGGGDDRLLLDYTEPEPGPDQLDVIEYYHAGLGHYFMTADPVEAAMIDGGVVVPGWTRTGYRFSSWTLGSGHGVAACRFYGKPGVGPNTHFYSILPNECAALGVSPYWQSEGLAFAEDAPAGDDCAPDRVPVVRLYNNSMSGTANHRFLTSHSEISAMWLAGWTIEGTVFCAPP